ncbi:MAG: exodeoxyribonuclease VII small subunit [Alkalibacterium sp.]|uniref:Exodeoxyribonuclease 7 small subunit n=1 Tax=Alkalibacterium gilvum TaxID=1130080 RepID=A0A1H6RHG2_9LACT|nr:MULTISPECIES: exodeoxyribonuclease VII small subunit [Alkalibacterium]MDN6294008.1 exodeoxyribonuclease VII small subunit [Alkalibacterium sp.]MDN6295640.1 exodeoxyribonuclease VII small subunit [Alkalibacterium sp.]MDN6326519.1 exodeoxyribonuclease VII small subunit [Alkalibacterium sp.]MDN6385413.1 exodeoxyribonuclease VII small subunit [Alkalibacterium sp.]MDN6397840.1 exodeoxyribonuclease VII small subunit [Alkalibacterium sp.]
MSNEKTFDEAIKELETIVQKLEQGDVPLEEALDQFQEGIKLSRHCKSIVENAEKTVTTMVNENGTEELLED